MKIGKVINYSILIKPTDNFGFSVTVGCGKFGFPDVDSLMYGLSSYLREPKEYEKMYNAIPGNSQAQVIEAVPETDAAQVERER